MEYKLSLREAEVARLLLKNMNAKQISEKLGLARGTVHMINSRLREKTGFPDTPLEAAKIAQKRGML